MILINIVSAVEGDLPILIISDELDHADRPQLLRLYKELTIILEGQPQNEKQSILKNYFRGFRQL